MPSDPVREAAREIADTITTVDVADDMIETWAAILARHRDERPAGCAHPDSTGQRYIIRDGISLRLCVKCHVVVTKDYADVITARDERGDLLDVKLRSVRESLMEMTRLERAGRGRIAELERKLEGLRHFDCCRRLAQLEAGTKP